MMTGWTSTPREADKSFLLPSVRSLPELGRLTGRGDTLNLERLLADKPDIIIDFRHHQRQPIGLSPTACRRRAASPIC